MSRRPQGGKGPASAPVQLTVESLAHGGESVSHLDGMAVFLQGGVPGDVVEASIQPQGRFARGRVLKVLQPSPGRQESDCRLHPACGGCPWMEVGVADQGRAKEQILQDALTRIGKLSMAKVDVMPLLVSPKTVGYRHRARLHSERQGDRRVLGFLPARGRGVVPVDACRVLEAPLEKALKTAARVLSYAPEEPFDVQLSGEPEELGGRVGIWIETHARPDVARWRRSVGQLVKEGIHAVEVSSRGHTVAQANLDKPLRYAIAPGVAGGPYLHDAACFTQGNRFQNVNMIQRVLGGMKLTGVESVLELHAGCGNFTLALARQAKRVVALESFPRAVEFARENVRRAGMDARVKTLVVDCDDIKKVTHAAGPAVDVLLLDPPRTGAPAVARIAADLKPRRIVYVSCNPATLARDLAQLVAAGWVLKSVEPLDLFPRTWHVEAVAVLERKEG